jgi:aspartyl-tRNA(Asn)/glutamyl-tRNA(Gln) amidotransferase subunit A
MDEQQAREIAYMPALEMRERFRRRELSPVEVTGVILERIGVLNPKLNAYLTVTVERALDDARAAEQRYAPNSTTEPGPLCGIPMSIKDITATAGIRTTRGSLLYENWVPDADAVWTERVYAAGGVMLGKTNTPEFGWKGDSGNRLIGPSRNPWNLERTSGGSSGGSSAAIAAGLGQLAQGTDGAGSVRIPAGFCGIFGMKPSFGLVPYAPPSSVAALAHNGPMTRTVRDGALLLNAVAGADARDPNSFSSGVDYLAACEGGIAGLRVAWSPDLGFAAIDPEVRELTTRAAARLSELGCQVDDVTIDLPDPWPIVDTLWVSAQAGTHKDDFEQVADRIDPGRISLVERGRTLSAVDLYDAYVQRSAYTEAMRQFMENYDLLVTPQLPVTAFPAGDDHPGTVAGRPVNYLNWTQFTYPFNVTGQPAATLPCGFASDGLPVALQFVGRWRDDATVLRAAAAWESLAPWADRQPAIE